MYDRGIDYVLEDKDGLFFHFDKHITNPSDPLYHGWWEAIENNNPFLQTFLNIENAKRCTTDRWSRVRIRFNGNLVPTRLHSVF